LDNGSFDNCSTVTFSTSQVLFDCSHLGDNTVTLTVTDGNGNSSTCDAIVTVMDDIAPTPDVAELTAVEGQCSATIALAPMATDNCGAVITGVSTDPMTYNDQGTYTVTWTYTDAFGNSSTQTQEVVVADTNAPVADVASLPDLTGECEFTVTVFPTSTDECVGAIVGTTSDPLTYSDGGEHTITWTYDDGRGNVSTQTQLVIISDAVAPVPDASELVNIMVPCGTTLTDLPTATDNCAGQVIGTTDILTFTDDGTYTITWSYNDGNGNVSTQNQQVTVNGIPETMIEAEACGGYDAPDGTYLTTSGIYTFQFPNGQGCDSTVILDLTIQTEPEVIIFAVGDSLFADVEGEGLTFQWMNCSNNTIIEGETDQYFLPPYNSFYSVIVTEGTCSVESSCFSYNLSGTKDLALPENIKVYPNPFLDYLSIEFENQLDEVEITLFDVQGKRLIQQTYINRENVLFRTEDLISGFYMLQLKIGDQIYRTKLIRS